MIGHRVRNVSFTSLAVLATMGLSACEGDNNPYGPPFEDIFGSVMGAYRPEALLTRNNPFAPGEFQPAADGSDIRISLGSSESLGGRVFLPGAGPGGSDVRESLLGKWTYDVPAQTIFLDLDPSLPFTPSPIVLKLEFLLDRILLKGTANVSGVPVTFDLAKPLPPETFEPGCAFRSCFDDLVVPSRRGGLEP